MAFQIENNLDKNEILELYLNTSYFGDGYCTPKEAARGYFHKELEELTESGRKNNFREYKRLKNKKLKRKICSCIKL